MLYSALTTEELERWVNASPADTAAKAELLRRVPDLMDNIDAELEEANDDNATLRSEIEAKSKELEEVAAEHDEAIDSMQSDLDEANTRIAELTRAGDLV